MVYVIIENTTSKFHYYRVARSRVTKVHGLKFKLKVNHFEFTCFTLLFSSRFRRTVSRYPIKIRQAKTRQRTM